MTWQSLNCHTKPNSGGKITEERDVVEESKHTRNAIGHREKSNSACYMFMLVLETEKCKL